MNLAKDQLFCLLGPNGAGKTTAINCLTGITPVTGGDGMGSFGNLYGLITSFEQSVKLSSDNYCWSLALIYQNSIRSSVGMTKIRRIIGVCPQVLCMIYGLCHHGPNLYL